MDVIEKIFFMVATNPPGRDSNSRTPESSTDGLTIRQCGPFAMQQSLFHQQTLIRNESNRDHSEMKTSVEKAT